MTLREGVNVPAGRNATNRTSLLQGLITALGSDRVSLKAKPTRATPPSSSATRPTDAPSSGVSVELERRLPDLEAKRKRVTDEIESLEEELEAIDSDRVATLPEYFESYVPYLVVALLHEDAQAVDEDTMIKEMPNSVSGVCLR